jgi:hypothetical protein
VSGCFSHGAVGRHRHRAKTGQSTAAQAGTFRNPVGGGTQQKPGSCPFSCRSCTLGETLPMATKERFGTMKLLAQLVAGVLIACALLLTVSAIAWSF